MCTIILCTRAQGHLCNTAGQGSTQGLLSVLNIHKLAWGPYADEHTRHPTAAGLRLAHALRSRASTTIQGLCIGNLAAARTS